MTQLEIDDTSRPSIYLARKAGSLLEAIRFFLSDVKANEKRLVFLAQIDFWDWELDNLIYSFETFNQRSQDWESDHSIKQKLVKQGLVIKINKLIDLRWSRPFNLKPTAQVYAPLPLLKETLDAWHELLAICEKSLLQDEEKITSYAQRLGANVLANLDKYRKTLPWENK